MELCRLGWSLLDDHNHHSWDKVWRSAISLFGSYSTNQRHLRAGRLHHRACINISWWPARPSACTYSCLFDHVYVQESVQGCSLLPSGLVHGIDLPVIICISETLGEQWRYRKSDKCAMCSVAYGEIRKGAAFSDCFPKKEKNVAKFLFCDNG